MIEGNDLRIRPLRDCPADIAVMARWLTDPRVLLDPVVSNARAIRAYEKCGFRRVGIMARQEFANGQWHDQLLMEYRP